MATAETKRRATSAAVFLLPLLLVKGTALLLGDAGPVAASAGVVAPPSPVTTPQEHAATAEPTVDAEVAAAALKQIARLKREPFGEVPLYYEPREQTHRAEPEPTLDPPPHFTVGAIMASASGNIALIDGTACRVKQQLADTGWIITDIDPAARTVTIEDPHTGRTETRGVER